MQSLDPDTLARLQASQDADYAQMSFEGTLQLVSQAPVTTSDPEDANAFKDLNWTLIAHRGTRCGVRSTECRLADCLTDNALCSVPDDRGRRDPGTGAGCAHLPSDYRCQAN